MDYPLRQQDEEQSQSEAIQDCCYDARQCRNWRAYKNKKILLSRGRAIRFYNLTLPLDDRIIRYYATIIPNLEAEEELKQRGREGQLTPDKFYSLLLLSGVPEKEADTARARMVMQQLESKSQWQR